MVLFKLKHGDLILIISYIFIINFYIMTIQKLEQQPNEIKAIYLNCVIMPNGQIIYKGKSLGFYTQNKDYIFEKKDQNIPLL